MFSPVSHSSINLPQVLASVSVSMTTVPVTAVDSTIGDWRDVGLHDGGVDLVARYMRDSWSGIHCGYHGFCDHGSGVRQRGGIPDSRVAKTRVAGVTKPRVTAEVAGVGEANDGQNSYKLQRKKKLTKISLFYIGFDK